MFNRVCVDYRGPLLFFQNIILNMNDHGFKVVAFNRTVEKVDAFLENEAKGTEVIGAKSLQVCMNIQC